MPKINLRMQNSSFCIISILLTLFFVEITLRVMGGRLGLESQEAFYESDSLLGWRHVAGEKGVFRIDEYAVEENFNSKGVWAQNILTKRNQENFNFRGFVCRMV